MKPLVINQNAHDSSDILKLYFKEIRNSQKVDEDDLCKRIQSGDNKALHTLIVANLKFVVSVAKQHLGYGLQLEDLISEGNLGLIRAAELYDSSTGNKFISYAVWHIRAKILSFIQNNSTSVRFPQNKSSEVVKLKKQIEKLEQEMGEEITHAVAISLFDDNEIVDLLYNRYGKRDVSLDMKYGDDSDSPTLLESKIVMDDSFRQDLKYDTNDMIGVLDHALGKLSREDRDIIKHFIGYKAEQLKIKEISEKFDMHTYSINLKIKKCFNTLRREIILYDSLYVKEISPNVYNLDGMISRTIFDAKIEKKNKNTKRIVFENAQHISLVKENTKQKKEPIEYIEIIPEEIKSEPKSELQENFVKKIFKKIFSFK